VVSSIGTELLTVKQAAKELGVSKCTVYRWIKRKWLGHNRLANGTIRIPRVEIAYALAGKQ